MSGKSRAFAVAAAAAGVIGIWAPAASAYTGPSGDNGGVVNFAHNQVPVQACNDTVPVNVLGVQVPVDRVSGSLGLLNLAPTVANQDSSCHQASAQANAPAGHMMRAKAMSSDKHMDPQWGPGAWRYAGPSGDNGGVVNLSHNQVPIQACNDTVPVSVLGVQVPVQEVAAALGLLSPGGAIAVQDSSCHQAQAQKNS
jgi:hypothetical protein